VVIETGIAGHVRPAIIGIEQAANGALNGRDAALGGEVPLVLSREQAN
jgi:hypothetical protein